MSVNRSLCRAWTTSCASSSASTSAPAQKAGLSQERLAELCDLDRTEISLLERGLRSPRLDTLVMLARGLELSSPCELLEGSAERPTLASARAAARDLPLAAFLDERDRARVRSCLRGCCLTCAVALVAVGGHLHRLDARLRGCRPRSSWFLIAASQPLRAAEPRHDRGREVVRRRSSSVRRPSRRPAGWRSSARLRAGRP